MNTDTAVLLGQSVEVFSKKNVLGSHVGKDQVNLSFVAVGTATNNGANDLEHRCDASTSGNHAKVADHVGGVDKGTLGTTDTDGLADNKGSHVLGDVALGIRLDQEIKVSGLVVARDRGIRAHNLLGGAILLLERSADRDVLTDGEAEDGLGRRELEAVAIKGKKKRSMLVSLRMAIKLAINTKKLLRGVAGQNLCRSYTYMATLCEMTVFSWSSNSWKTSGLRTFLISAGNGVSHAYKLRYK